MSGYYVLTFVTLPENDEDTVQTHTMDVEYETAEDIEDALNAINDDCVWLLADCGGFGNLLDRFSTYQDIEDMVTLLETNDSALLHEVVDHLNDNTPNSVEEYLDNMYGVYESAEQWAQDYYESQGVLEGLPWEIRSAIDWSEVAGGLSTSYTVLEIGAEAIAVFLE